MLKRSCLQGNSDVITFTVKPTASAKTLVLDGLASPLGAVVDWGDGTVSAMTSSEGLSHTYSDTLERVVTIRGTLSGLWNDTEASTGQTLITRINEIRSSSLKSMANMFRGCSTLEELPASFFVPNVADFSNAFRDCSGFTGEHPALWDAYPHSIPTHCFTNCFQSFWGKYSAGCVHRTLVPSVATLTYYQHYGQTSCPKATYVPSSSALSYYGKYGTGCPRRTLIPATPGKSFYQQYGTSCPKRSYVDATPAVTYFNAGYNNFSCPNKLSRISTITDTGHKSTCTSSAAQEPWKRSLSSGCGSGQNASNTHQDTLVSGTFQCTTCGSVFQRIVTYSSGGSTSHICDNSCSRIYKTAQPSYYKCSQTNTTCANTSCGVSYSDGIPDSYSCSQSGSTCQLSSCPYSYSTATSARYDCLTYGTCRSSSCAVMYQEGSASRSTCAKGGNCTETACAHPWANTTTFNAAVLAGWA